MAIQTESWLRDVQETLLPANDFVNKSKSHNEFVNDLTVHIPQAGTAVSVQKNRSTLPATIAERTDTDRTYNLNEYTTDPILIRDIDEIQTSYSKRQSVMRDHITQINDTIGQNVLNTWGGVGLISATNGQIVLTTGTSTSDITPPGGTSTRKAVLINDLASAASKLDEEDVPQDNRWMIMPAKMYHNMLLENSTELLHMDFMNKGNLPDAVVRRIWGFNIMIRSSVNIYENSATPVIRAVGAATATDDNFGAVGWHPDFVATAMGSIKVFANDGEAAFYGDILSARVDHGSTTLRTDGAGVVSIVQDT